MNPPSELQIAIRASVKEAILKTGVDAFKSTPMFLSNQRQVGIKAA